ncbi:hypothetical protein [Microbacterium sp. NPDC078849]|uniref:hypothetical protein n=1 Tax=unclassified Microbacterium TaxID=2609290 RepID=UPI00344BD42A
MRVILGIACGLTASILAYVLWRPTLAWTLTRVPPSTHPDCHPRFRTWHLGIETLEEPR